MKPIHGSPHACPLCGEQNRCAVAGTGRFDVVCWCSRIEVAPAALARVRKGGVSMACLCPRCAAAATVEARA